jgi:hypothetical protein
MKCLIMSLFSTKITFIIQYCLVFNSAEIGLMDMFLTQKYENGAKVIGFCLH